MNEVAPIVFKKLLSAKRREVIFTRHAEHRAAQRFLNREIVEADLLHADPVKVLEQEPGKQGERKFDVYYIQRTGVFHRYVLCLNNSIRMITLMRTSKLLQKMVSGGLR